MILLSEAQALFAYSQAIRRDLHMYPEIGFQEVRTSGIISNELRKLGLETSTGIAKTGVVALIKGSRPGPVVMLRLDMDALPIHEETIVEYSSRIPGIMHACGHDGHVAIGLTVARLLCAHRQDFGGTVKLVFQPAEEGLGGAKAMIKEGVLENPAPIRILGLHIWNEKPVGWLGIAAGPIMAGSMAFKIKVKGKGGHAEKPHLNLDPILAAAQMINAWQSIVSRNLNPLEVAVITVSSIHGGDAEHITPPYVEMKGTIRFFKSETEEMIRRRFEEITNHVATDLGCAAEIYLGRSSPPVVNDPATAGFVLQAAKELFPGEMPDTHGHFTMTSEDFAVFQQKTPGAFFLVGSSNPGCGLDYGLHHPKFNFDEAVLPRAAVLMANSAILLVNSQGPL